MKERNPTNTIAFYDSLLNKDDKMFLKPCCGCCSAFIDVSTDTNQSSCHIQRGVYIYIYMPVIDIVDSQLNKGL